MPESKKKTSFAPKSDKKIKAPPFQQQLQFVLEDPNLTDIWEVLLYSYIYGFYVGNTTITSSNQYLADLFRCSVDTIKSRLASLEAKGYIQRIQITEYQRQLIPLGGCKGSVTNTDNSVDNQGEGRALPTTPGALPPTPQGAPPYNIDLNIDLNNSISIDSNFSESEIRIHELIVKELGDSSFTLSQARLLIKEHRQHKNMTILESIEYSIKCFITFLATNDSIKNKVAYFIKVIKKDKFFGDIKQYKKSKTKDDLENRYLDASHIPHRPEKDKITGHCRSMGLKTMSSLLSNLKETNVIKGL